MYKVTFLSDFMKINSGFSTNISLLERVSINGTVYDVPSFQVLEQLGVVSLSLVDGFSRIPECPGCDDCCDVEISSPSEEFVFHIVGEQRDKVTKAVTEDIANRKFAIGSAYKFYDIENKSWKTSRLKKTASHLGRVSGGFAVPIDATNKKMFNRLEKLSVMYGLGLTREVCRDITQYGI